MAARTRCPRCGETRVWTLNDGRHRCARCRFDWRPGRLPLRLTPSQWRSLLRWFVRGAPSADIARETRLDRKRVLRALTVVRTAIRRSFPTEASRDSPAEGIRVPGPVTLGLSIVHGREWVDMLPKTAVAELGGAFTSGRLVDQLSRRFDRYAAIVYRGRLYRLPEPRADQPTIPFGRIEAFWAYLQRQLRAKGGIRRERLALYLGEYVWRYQHRHLSQAEQVKKLTTLIRRHRLEWQEQDFPTR